MGEGALEGGLEQDAVLDVVLAVNVNDCAVADQLVLEGSCGAALVLDAGVEDGVLLDGHLSASPVAHRPHTGELVDFYEAVVNNKPSPVPVEQSLKVIAILEGIAKSSEQGKEIRLKL